MPGTRASWLGGPPPPTASSAAIALDRIPSRERIKERMLAEEYTADTAEAHTTLRFLVPPGVVNWGGNAVRIGRIVELEARLLHTGARSMHIAVEVWSADRRTPADRARTTLCMSVFVVPAGDGSGAVPVPPGKPERDEDRRHDAHARELIALRRDIALIPPALALAP